MILKAAFSQLFKTAVRKARLYSSAQRGFALPLALLACMLFGVPLIVDVLSGGKSRSLGTQLTGTIETAFKQFATVGRDLSIEIKQCRFDLRFDCIRYPRGFDHFNPWATDSVPPKRVPNVITGRQACQRILRERMYTLKDYTFGFPPEQIIGYRCRDASAPPPPRDGTRTETGRAIDDNFACYAVDPSAQDGWSVLCHPRSRAPWSFFGGEWESHAGPVSENSGVLRRLISGLAYYGEKAIGLFVAPLNVDAYKKLGGLATGVLVVLTIFSGGLAAWLVWAGIKRWDGIILLPIIISPIPFILVLAIIPVLLITALGIVFEFFVWVVGTEWAGWLYSGFVWFGGIYVVVASPFNPVFKGAVLVSTLYRWRQSKRRKQTELPQGSAGPDP